MLGAPPLSVLQVDVVEAPLLAGLEHSRHSLIQTLLIWRSGRGLLHCAALALPTTLRRLWVRVFLLGLRLRLRGLGGGNFRHRTRETVT